MPLVFSGGTDSMILGAGHSLMVSNTPLGLNVQLLSDNFFGNSQVKDTINSYGFFGSGLNYHTFYPDATKADFVPSEDDYIEPTFRMISACIVAKGWNPTDFSKLGVLKESMSLLVGQTVNCDHETDVGNAIGAVSQVAWQNAYTTEDGIKIPAGINAKLKIDAKSNPRIARGINMDPPAIHSNSVTVRFQWEPSHPFEKEWEFYSALGTIHEDGTMVRRIVTKIISYQETSLVSHGADPFAQIIKDGKIINPAYAGSQYYSFSEDKQKEIAKELEHQMYSMDFKSSFNSFEGTDIMYNTGDSLINGKTINTSNNNPNKENMEALQKFLAKLIGTDMLTLSEGETAFTEETALAAIAAIVKRKTELEAQLSDAVNGPAALKTKLEAYKDVDLENYTENMAMSAVGKAHLSDIRARTLASYKKLYPENQDTNILALIEGESTSLNTLISLGKTYDQSLEEKFPMKCTACGSKDVSRASTAHESEDDEDETTNDSYREADISSVIMDIDRRKRLGENQ